MQMPHILVELDIELFIILTVQHDVRLVSLKLEAICSFELLLLDCLQHQVLVNAHAVQAIEQWERLIGTAGIFVQAD